MLVSVVQAALVSLVICLAAEQCLSMELLADESIIFTYAFFRHGIRSPLYKPYPTDPNKAQYHTYFPGRAGQLTKVGKRQTYHVGKVLRRRYEQLVKQYSEDSVHVSTTNTSRTTMTALATMAGMFPPEKPLFQDLRWQPIPVWQNTDDLDKAYIYNDENYPEIGLQNCPRYGTLIQKGYNKTLRPDLTPGRKELYELLQNYTGDPNVNCVDSLYHIWDTLQFESLNGLPLPPWATRPQPDYDNKSLYPDVMQPVMVEWFRDNEYLNNNEEMLQFYTGPLFNSIHEHLKKKADKPKSQEKLKYHATHDTTLFVLLWALRVQQPQAVGPGDGLLFELHLTGSTATVKMYYYHSTPHHSVQELVSPLCPSPCSLAQFIQVTPRLTPRQWQNKCQVHL